MPDISKCSDWSCPLRKKCYRYRVKGSKYNQAYTKWMRTGPLPADCDGFWDIKDYTERNLISLKDLGEVDDAWESRGEG